MHLYLLLFKNLELLNLEFFDDFKMNEILNLDFLIKKKLILINNFFVKNYYENLCNEKIKYYVYPP